MLRFGLALLLLHVLRVAAAEEKVNVTLFYESYCPFSRKFVVEQLFPTTVKYHRYLNLDLIPFGNCKTTHEPNGTWDFKCQHGEKECYGNRVQACVIEQGRNKDPARMVMALTCLMYLDYTDNDIQKCLGMAELSLREHQECMQNDATTLEVEYGRRTYTNEPRVHYVPLLMFNGIFDSALEASATRNLEQVVCSLLRVPPPTCSSYNYV